MFLYLVISRLLWESILDSEEESSSEKTFTVGPFKICHLLKFVFEHQTGEEGLVNAPSEMMNLRIQTGLRCLDDEADRV